MTACAYCKKPATTTFEEGMTDVPVCEDCYALADADAHERACLARVAPFDGDQIAARTLRAPVLGPGPFSCLAEQMTGSSPCFRDRRALVIFEVDII